MTSRFSLWIAWAARLAIGLLPVAALYLLLDLDRFRALAATALQWLPVQWGTVQAWQWYALWGATVTYLAIGVAGLWFLQKAFANFARGELFNEANSRDLRRFAQLLFVQALARPLLHTSTGVLMTINHPPGQKVLSLAFGSQEVLFIGLAMVLWVMSDLLVKGSRLEAENRSFV